jgi:hypothetical protein
LEQTDTMPVRVQFSPRHGGNGGRQDGSNAGVHALE